MARSIARQDFLASVLVTAVEGGINYWAIMTGYHWKQDENHNLTSAEVMVLPDEDGAEWHKVTVGKIARGIQPILSTDFAVREDILRSIAGANVTNDAGEIDSEAADVIVQAALFGKLVYG